MSEEIKAQTQKVYDARQNQKQAWDAVKAAESLTDSWSSAVDQLRAANELLELEQHVLANLMIESVLGKSAY